MAKIIIGIHGLANKPTEKLLKDWWKCSIKEGLTKNCKLSDPAFKFDLVYWADLLYKYPMHHDGSFDFDHLYNNEPYYHADSKDLKKHADHLGDTLRKYAGKILGDTVDALKGSLGIDAFADFVLGKVLKDMAFYYDPKRKIMDKNKKTGVARNVLQDVLKQTILANRGKEILLIAHSMGSIIAYDVLRDLGRENSGAEVAHFVTIGSPLGLPHVKGKIIEERAYDKKASRRVRTPSIVTQSWTNFADRLDPVALDSHLSDDYSENSKGIRVQDDLVLNDYRKPKKGQSGTTEMERDPEGKNNHHKSYGYLRTPELSELVKEFI